MKVRALIVKAEKEKGSSISVMLELELQFLPLLDLTPVFYLASLVSVSPEPCFLITLKGYCLYHCCRGTRCNNTLLSLLYNVLEIFNPCRKDRALKVMRRLLMKLGIRTM